MVSEKWLTTTLTLCLLISVLTIAGGNAFHLATILTIFVLSIIGFFILSTCLTILRESKFFFYLFVLSAGIFTYLVFYKFSPVVYGGQDPGYYQNFANVLSKGLGAHFKTDNFELFSGGKGYSFWSTYSGPIYSEIQFYPFMPSLLACISIIVGDYSYACLAVMCNLILVLIVIRYKFAQTQNYHSFTPLLWLFVPATLWFSRTPASETVSILLTTVAILVPPYSFKNRYQGLLVSFVISASLFLNRGNPLSWMLLIIICGYLALTDVDASDRYKRFFHHALIQSAGVAFGALIYLLTQPNFFSILVTQTYAPFFKYFVVFVAVIAIGILAERTQNSTSAFLQFRLKFNQVFTSLFPFFSYFLIFAISAYVLLSNSWGIYSPHDFGIGSSVRQRFTHTPLFMMASSFGIILSFIRFSSNKLQKLIFLAFCFFAVSTAIRTPGIPYSYYFQRYWWSEVALFVYFAIVFTDVKSFSWLNMRISNRFVQGLVFLTIIFQIFTFDWRLVQHIEVGRKDNSAFSLIAKSNSVDEYFAVRPDLEPSFISQVIVPLKYTYQVKISRLDFLNQLGVPRSKIRIIQDKECSSRSYGEFSLDIFRLRSIGNRSAGIWYFGKQNIYMCNYE